MPEFSIRNIVSHLFHVNNEEGESVIRYVIIIVQDLMAKISLTADFIPQVLTWDNTVVQIKDPNNSLDQYNLCRSKMHEMIIHTTKPASIKEANKRMAKVIDSTHDKAKFEQVVDGAVILKVESPIYIINITLNKTYILREVS